jgi:hypothetical protein
MKFVRAIPGLILVAVMGVGLYFLIRSLLDWVATLSPQTVTPVFALVGVLSVPIVTYFTSRALEKRKALDQATRQHKTDLYKELIEELLKMLKIGGGKAMTDAEMTAMFGRVTPSLITFGSKGVIRAWVAFRLHPWATAEARDGMLKFERVLKEIRKDLGQSVFGLKDGELLKMFINDWDSVKPAIP